MYLVVTLYVYFRSSGRICQTDVQGLSQPGYICTTQANHRGVFIRSPLSQDVSTRRSKFYPLTFLESGLIHNSHRREKRACRVAYCQPESESSDGRSFYPRSNVKLTNTVRINHHDPQNQITLIQLLTITEGLKRELCTQQKVPGQNLI